MPASTLSRHESSRVESSRVESSRAESNRVEPSRAEPNRVKSWWGWGAAEKKRAARRRPSPSASHTCKERGGARFSRLAPRVPGEDPPAPLPPKPRARDVRPLPNDAATRDADCSFVRRVQRLLARLDDHRVLMIPTMIGSSPRGLAHLDDHRVERAPVLEVDRVLARGHERRLAQPLEERTTASSDTPRHHHHQPPTTAHKTERPREPASDRAGERASDWARDRATKRARERATERAID